MAVGDFDSLYNVTPGRHLYQFYKGSDDYMSIMSSYFQSGLEKDNACIWLVSERLGLRKVKAFAEIAIPDSDQYFLSGQLKIMSAEDWYLTDGRFDPAKALANAQQAVTEALEAGFKTLRGAGDAGAIPRDDWPKLHEYEKQIDEVVKSAPIIALCTYPILECSITDTKAVVEGHDSVLVGRI